MCVYDDNHITIDGDTNLTYNDDVPMRFEAYGWHVEQLGEMANDLDGLEAAIRRAMDVTDRPSLLVLRSHIAYPSTRLHTDDHEAHGNPFNARAGQPHQRRDGHPQRAVLGAGRTGRRHIASHASTCVAPKAVDAWQRPIRCVSR